MSTQPQDSDAYNTLDIVRELLTQDAHHRACVVRRLCQRLESLSTCSPEQQQQQQHPHGPEQQQTENKRLLELLRVVATDDVDAQVRMAAVSVPCVPHDSLLNALKDKDFSVRLQSIQTIVRSWLLNHVLMVDIAHVLAAIVMEPEVSNIVQLIDLVGNMLSEHTPASISVDLKRNDCPDNAIDDQCSLDAIMAQVALLSEHESEIVRAAVASAISSVIPKNFIGVDNLTLATCVTQVLRNLSQDPSLLVVRAASHTILSILQLPVCPRHYAQLRYIHTDQILALLFLHGGKAQAAIASTSDVQLVIQLLNCSRCHSFQAYCLAVTFLQRRLFCAQLKTAPLSTDDFRDLWTECLLTLAEHHPEFETIVQLGRKNYL